jgi:ATP-dependent protease ClpP protease subunit
MNRLQNLYRNNARRGIFNAKDNTIFLYDMIVADDLEADWFGGISPRAFAETLRGMKGNVTLRINSPGGDVFGGRAMVTAIREYRDKITAQIDGVAASAASIIATAASKVVMAEGTLMMIHKAHTISLGNADDFRATADLLEKIDQQIADSYATRGKHSAADYLSMMKDETWFTPDEALEAGLADETIAADQDKKAACWDLSAYAHPPKLPEPEPEPVDNSRRARIHAVRMLERTA